MTSQRKLCITAGGGLGDQVCAEPVLRYMKETWYRDDDIAVMTQFPALFRHLPVTVYDRPVQFPEVRATVSTHPVPGPDGDPFDRVVNFNRIHPLDYIAIRLLRRTLPNSYKQIQLHPGVAARARVQRLLSEVPGSDAISRMVLLHAGRAWPSKTLPASCWQAYIDLLKAASSLPVLIGQEFVHQATRNEL